MTQTIESDQTLRIVRLEVEAFKRLRAVGITVDAEGNLVEITGRNGQGKSSTLDAIMAALAGGRSIPDQAVRKGHDRATITVKLAGHKGDQCYVVTRKITKSGQSLTITTPDGEAVKSPQSVLDAMLGDLTFDPMEFCAMEPRAQVETIKAIAGLNERFTELDRQQAEAQAALTAARTDVKRAEAVLTVTANVDGPDEETSLAALSEELAAAQATIDTNNKARNWLTTMRKSLADNAAEIQGVNAQIKALTDRLGVLEEAGRQMQAQIDGHEPKVSAMRDPDVAAIRARVHSVESDNAAARKRKAHRDAKAALDGARDAERAAGRRKDKIIEERNTMLAEARLPVKGLAFTDDGVTLNGLPFEQASTAEQIRASFAIAMAQKPRIRIALVRQGSLLDRDGKRLLAAVAAEHDAQVWMETVTNGEKVGIVIEDGEVVAGGGQ